jgi:hypothetical protein
MSAITTLPLLQYNRFQEYYLYLKKERIEGYLNIAHIEPIVPKIPMILRGLASLSISTDRNNMKAITTI